MSLLLEALKKAEKAKRGAPPPVQAKEPVAPDTPALDFEAPLPPPAMETEARMPAGESAFPEITLDDVAPPEPPSAPPATLQPEPDARESMLFMPDLAVMDLPEMALAGMRSNSQMESAGMRSNSQMESAGMRSNSQREAKTEPVLSLDFPEPEPFPQPPLQLAVPAFEPAAPQIAPAPISAPPPPPSPRVTAEAGQAGMGGLPPNSQITPDQETAKKILAAKQGQPKCKRNPKLLAGLLVFSMAVGAAAAYYYWQAVTQPTLNFPLPQQAETPPEAQPAAAEPSAQPAETDDGAAQPVPAQLPAGDAGTGEEVLAGMRSASPPNSQAGQAGMGGLPPNSQKPPRHGPAAVDAARIPRGAQEKSSEKPTASSKQGDTPSADSSPAKKAVAIPFDPDKAAVKSPAITGVPDSGIKIRRDAGEAKLDPLLASAYQSFMTGDTGKAETDYRKALQRTPNSRDALLGLAAIAASRNQAQEAASLYLRVLQLDPGDAAAQTGLIGLKGNADPTMSESRLKLLLAQSPGAGYLHFALGNLYAQQSRWPEAQEAYFNALHTDPGNADYAFNLAVSLDHLDQRKPALVYYQRARNLVKERPAGFNGEQLEKRIHELQRPD